MALLEEALCNRGVQIWTRLVCEVVSSLTPERVTKLHSITTFDVFLYWKGYAQWLPSRNLGESPW